MDLSRSTLATSIAVRITSEAEALTKAWAQSKPVPHVVIDDLLGADRVAAIRAAFPAPNDLHLRNTIRERKRVGIDLEAYDAVIGDALFAFQDPVVVAAVESVTGLTALRADPSLYASGVSVMGRGDFLGPHLDNSHDGDGANYRAVNLLYYVAGPPDGGGGELELWDRRVRQATPVAPRADRLVLMLTTNTSYHSVRRIAGDDERLCVSNYLFSPHPPTGSPYRHVTTFRGRPEQPVRRAVLRVDGAARNLAGRAMPWLLRRSFHRRD